MEQDLSALDHALAERDVDGYLLHADSADPDQYYLSGFDAPDPFVTLYDGEVHLLFNRSLEIGRARREARAATVESTTEYGYGKLAETHGPEAATIRSIARFLEAYDVGSVAVPPRFPLSTGDGIREQGITVTADEASTIESVRAIKTAAEIEHVRTAQAANQAAMATAESLLREASVAADGTLHHEEDPLTSERVKEAIEITLLRRGCGLDGTIVACGPDAADPHDRGSGPLQANEPIIVDIFPRDKTTKYHGDLTRTFCVGDPDPTLREWYDLTEAAYRAALAAIEPGVSADTVHAAACEIYEDAGLPTLRSDESTETGFIHSTGHGVGLAVHEQPRVATGGPELEPGHVITIEPGLYDPAVGGVRIEDLVVVTEDGYENLTDYPVELEP